MIQLFTGAIVSIIFLSFEENKSYHMSRSIFPDRKPKFLAGYPSGVNFWQFFFVIDPTFEENVIFILGVVF